MKQNKKTKGDGMRKKTISLFEIFVLVISIVTIAYFVGDEFGVVSAKAAVTNDLGCTDLCQKTFKNNGYSGECKSECSGTERSLTTTGD
jgi:hypothetical protein